MKYLAILALLLSSASFGQRTYSTTFPATEDPICLDGKGSPQWINGGNGGGGACAGTGLQWSNMGTTGGTPGFAYNVSGTGVLDGIAVVAGTWGPNQYAKGTARCKSPATENFPEIELHLNKTITANNISGYEFDLKCFRGVDSSSYGSIVRWNGPPNNFTVFSGQCNGINCGAADGDIVEAFHNSTTGRLNLYVNGILQATAIDDVFTGGGPGIGGDLSSGTSKNEGFSSFFASDENPMPPTALTATVQ